MASILARIQVKPGAEAQFEKTARELYAVSHGSEKALRRYEYWRGHEPGIYYCLLAFDDYLGFMAHQTSAHHEAAVPPLMETVADMKFEWIDPVAGASDLPATAPQELPADDELARTYAAMMPLAVQAWWAALREASK